MCVCAGQDGRRVQSVGGGASVGGGRLSRRQPRPSQRAPPTVEQAARDRRSAHQTRVHLRYVSQESSAGAQPAAC